MLIFGEPTKIQEYRRIIPEDAFIVMVTPLGYDLPKLDFFSAMNVKYFPAEYILATPNSQ